MDMIWNAITHSPVLLIVIGCVAAYVVSQLTSRSYSNVRKKDLVPQHVRFERRDGEGGDRRHPRAFAYLGLERRTATRRG